MKPTTTGLILPDQYVDAQGRVLARAQLEAQKAARKRRRERAAKRRRARVKRAALAGERVADSLLAPA